MFYFGRKIPPRIQLSGDKDRAKNHVGIGMKLLNLVENQASFQGLQQYIMRKVLPDGTAIRAIKLSDHGFIEIFTPPIKEREIGQEIPEAEILGPEVLFPWFYTVKLETEFAVFYITKDDYTELNLGFEAVYRDKDKVESEGPLESDWINSFNEPKEFVHAYKQENNLSFKLLAYNNIPEAWSFVRDNPEHPLSSKHEENPPSSTRPRCISLFEEDPSKRPSTHLHLDIILRINNTVNSWNFNEDNSDWLIMDSETEGGEIACALTKLQLLYDKEISKDCMDLVFVDVEKDPPTKALVIVYLVQGVLFLDAPNREATMKKDRLLTSLDDEDVYPEPWLFSKTWPKSFWGHIGKAEDYKEDDFKKVEPEDLREYWEIPKEGKIEIKPERDFFDVEDNKRVRVGLFTLKYEDDEEEEG